MAICMCVVFILAHCVDRFVVGCEMLIFHSVNLLCGFEWRFEEFGVIFGDNVKVLLRENIYIPLPPQSADDSVLKMAFFCKIDN